MCQKPHPTQKRLLSRSPNVPSGGAAHILGKKLGFRVSHPMVPTLLSSWLSGLERWASVHTGSTPRHVIAELEKPKRRTVEAARGRLMTYEDASPGLSADFPTETKGARRG